MSIIRGQMDYQKMPKNAEKFYCEKCDFICCKQSNYMNGQTLEADGGLANIDPASLSKEI